MGERSSQPHRKSNHGILDGIEKLITEHGSAAILKERIQLVNDRYAALERKAAAELQAENARLKQDNHQLSERVGAIEEQGAKRDGGHLDGENEKALQVVAQHGEVSREVVAHALRESEERAEFHLSELTDASLLHASYSYLEPNDLAAQPGREATPG